MPREKQYATRAEQQAAYRERQRQRGVVDSPQEGTFEEDIPGLDSPQATSAQATLELGTLVWEGAEHPVVRKPPIAESEYVREQTAQALRAIMNGFKDVEFKGEKNLDRAARYARWRYRGFCVGAVASL